MTAAWMAWVVALSAALGVAAMAAERVLRLYRLPTRWAWAASMALSLLLPLLLAPRGTTEIELAAAPTTAEMFGEMTEAVTVTTVAADVPAETSGGSWAGALDAALPAGWAAASGALGLALLAASAVLAVRRRRWTAARMAGQAVLVSDSTGPAVVGVMRPAIVVPRWAMEWSEARQRLIVKHEAEHVRAGDPRLLHLALVAVVLLPWNPGLWWQLRRLRLAVEVDCDGRTLAGEPDVAAYGSLLLEVGRRSARGILPAAAFSEPRSFLERRIRMMTLRNPRRRAARAAVSLSVLAGAAALIAAVPAPPAPAALLDRLSSAASDLQQTTTADTTPRRADVRATGTAAPAGTVVRAEATATTTATAADVTRATATATTVGTGVASDVTGATGTATATTVAASDLRPADVGGRTLSGTAAAGGVATAVTSGQGISGTARTGGIAPAVASARSISGTTRAGGVAPATASGGGISGTAAQGDVVHMTVGGQPIVGLVSGSGSFEARPPSAQTRIATAALATYPDALRDAGVGGRARVNVTVDAEGRVTRADVAESTHPAIGQAARTAVLGMRLPTEEARAGETVPVTLSYEVTRATRAGASGIRVDPMASVTAEMNGVSATAGRARSAGFPPQIVLEGRIRRAGALVAAPRVELRRGGFSTTSLEDGGKKLNVSGRILPSGEVEVTFDDGAGGTATGTARPGRTLSLTLVEADLEATFTPYVVDGND